MEKHVWSICLGVAALLAGAAALATGTGEAESTAEGPDDAVVLGEEDLADRAEILRNMYRRITPPDVALRQDIGMWPAAWEEFGANWEAAAADREYGAWVVPIEVTQDAGATVVRDGNGAVLWRGWTDFARPESADVVLTGGLVAEEEWAVYEGIRDAVVRLGTAGGTPAPPVRSNHTNGLRFTTHEWTTNGTFRLGLAYEIDKDVDVFAYAVACTSSLVVATWTNDENQVVTDTNTVWTAVGLPFNGMESDWELRGTVAISNGVAEFEDSGFSEELSRLRFYAAAVAEDTDGDGLNDGWEDFVSHTSPSNQDSDGDGVPDGMDTMPATSNVWFEVVTQNTVNYWQFLGDCPSNAPRVGNDDWTWNIVGAAPTSDSVVSNVWVSGHVDDIISVDGTDVDSNPGPTNYYHQGILNLIDHPESHAFQLRLWDHPSPDYAGPNEVSLGNSRSGSFEVDWTWLVPLGVVLDVASPVAGASPNPPPFAGHRPWPFDVTHSPEPDKHLVVFFEDVADMNGAGNFVVANFDVSLAATITPDAFPVEEWTPQWTRMSGPASGTLLATNTLSATLRNPQQGGVYSFSFGLGYPGEVPSQANVVLPLAGAEIDSVVVADLALADAFAAKVNAKYMWWEKQRPNNGRRWFVNNGAGDYLGRPNNANAPTVWCYNQVNTADQFGMGAVCTWKGYPIRIAKASNFIVGYAVRKIGVSGIASWIAQTIGTWNDGAATKSWQAGQAVASGADYTATVRNMLKDIWDESDAKNRRLWPNSAPVDNFIAPSLWRNPDTEFTSPGFLYMENP